MKGRKIAEGLKRLLLWGRAELTELVYPRRATCMGCGSKEGMEEPWLCPACKKQLARSWRGAFPDEFLDGSAAAYGYRGAASGMVQNLKYRGVCELAPVMAEDMVRACRQMEPIGAEIVVSVPMHANRLRRRGYNQSELLAREVAKRLGVPYEDALVRVRDTVQQVKLSEEDRKTNLKDAFEASSAVRGWRVLLVDDVFTTGHTAYECAKALRAAGAISVSFLSYAKSTK